MITTADIFSLPNHQTKKDQDNALVNKNTETLHCTVHVTPILERLVYPHITSFQQFEGDLVLFHILPSDH